MKYRAICENHLYSKAYKKGKKAVMPTVAVYVLPDYRKRALMKANPEKKYVNRIGLTVGKKIGGAVMRNRAKRIIRHAYRNIDTETPVRTGNLIVLVAREAISGKKTGDVERELRRSLKKLELI
ncbi:MAG: ribonuclease P protein component [Clostridia bacterium]|nr:ribonuclease P protein component [Clostridia bacterium]